MHMSPNRISYARTISKGENYFQKRSIAIHLIKKWESVSKTQCIQALTNNTPLFPRDKRCISFPIISAAFYDYTKKAEKLFLLN